MPFFKDKKFYNIYGEVLKVSVHSNRENSLEIIIKNTQSDKLKQKEWKKIGLIVLIYLISFIIFPNNYFYYFHIIFVFLLLFVVNRLLCIVQSESLSIVRQFALQTSTQYALGKKTNFLIPTNLIHDVIINEVISNYKVIYMLQILTKGILSKNKPIVPLLEKLSPSLACLETIYMYVQNNLDKRISS